ncbi:uncharacterized protein LOC131856088 isoform X3 [Cryptomeria japonica]|uniref:uncharacterized protein LOC131856088 isoform X3 n=1 Tax=Cryptomeria japonica TaxID=3369 RepID=UPI0027DA5EC5|nr:uncharacterized protein LOC131856088 isoform X3 [Cryptomeria japonica]
MDVEKSSLCNCVVNFLLEENYLLTAFELLHELLEDGRESQAIRLKDFFADTNKFPPDHISSLHNLRLLDPQSLLEEKEAADEKAAITQYELRLAQEDIMKLKIELEKRVAAFSTGDLDVSQKAARHTIVPVCKQPSYALCNSYTSASQDISGESHGLLRTERLSCQQLEQKNNFSNLGPLKDNERRDLNCAVKEYLLSAGYKLTTMTFYEEIRTLMSGAVEQALCQMHCADITFNICHQVQMQERYLLDCKSRKYSEISNLMYVFVLHDQPDQSRVSTDFI